MMINLNNYEEYFLLYIDNELNEEQCAAVKAFIQQHPHLAAELEMLQGARLMPEDEISFSNKDVLYKAADSSININNYEEYFLLHTDKELSATQEAAVEQFVLQHPQLQETFLLLQSAKLTPELITCPDKQRLYKQTVKRIIPFYITRIAVAAAIAGVMVLAGNFLMNKNNHHPEVAKSTPPSKPEEKDIILPQQNVEPAILPQKKNSDVVVAKNETRRAEKVPVKASKNVGEKPVVNNNNDEDEQVVAQINALPKLQQAAPPVEDVVGNTAPAKQNQPATLKLLDEVSDKGPTPEVMYVSNNDNDVITKPAVYKELNTDAEDQTLYVGSLQLNKAKVNGLFKKAAHLLGGKAKDSNL